MHPPQSKNPKDVRSMFDRIVPRYDLLNRLMSLGLDRRWRRLAAAAAVPIGSTALDLGTGTGDLAEELRRQGATRVVGLDFSTSMLRAARSKWTGGERSWVLADALNLPFRDRTFDCLTNAFVLRNLADLRVGLCEMARVVRPGGRVVCLDMTQPPQGPFGRAYRVYFWRMMPPLAGLLSGDRVAYQYLPRSLDGFPAAPALSALLGEAGLAEVEVRLFGGGTVALHVGRKP